MNERVMDPDGQTRRQFCTRTCSATALAAVGALALLGQGCGDSPTTAEGDGSAPPLPVIDATVSGRLVSVSITGASALAAVPSSAFIRSALGDFLVARTGPQAFKALTTICTHQLYDSHNVPVGGCVINTGVSGPIFVCPCHGSRFNASGAVVVGPAPTELRSYPTTFADNVLTITA